MNQTDSTYEGTLLKIMQQGTDRGDRTGTGTRGLFGLQMRWHLQDGFPLVTTKRVYTRGIVEELLWFLSGSTNMNDLSPSVQKWWAPWARADGELGPIYGDQFRSASWWHDVTPKIFEAPEVDLIDGKVFGVGDLGSYRLTSGPNSPGESKEVRLLKSTWREMLRRCYHEPCKSHKSYGAKGVHVSPEWLLFDNFYRDAIRLPGWEMKMEYPDDMSLDKDIKQASNRYSKETCIWAGRYEQGLNTSTSKPFSAISPSGESVTFSSIGEMHREFGVNISAVHRCLNGALLSHHEWTGFMYLDLEADTARRFRKVDQLKQVIASIKHNPESRRHVIHLWNTPAMDVAELPCCHGSLIQFYVADGMLSCHMLQRSADMFIGVPVNIASYALLTHMIAQQCDLKVGEFIWTGGDCHIYKNHSDQVNLQLSRMPKPLCTLELQKADSIFAYKLEHVVFKDYDYHPAIAAPVSV